MSDYGGNGGVYDVIANDPDATLTGRADYDDATIAEISDLMNAFARLREAEEAIADASQRYMKLGATDMRALHLLIVNDNRGVLTTPSMIAAHLEISTASTTKLIDRLAERGHVTRRPHPHDRRAITVHIADDTRRAALQTVGAAHAQRFAPAAALSSDQRALVTRYLNATAEALANAEGLSGGEEPSGNNRPSDGNESSGGNGASGFAEPRRSARAGRGATAAHDEGTGIHAGSSTLETGRL